MVINADNTGWAAYALAFGLVTVSEYAAQFATSVFTLAVCITVAHFLKLFLNRRWPQQQRRQRKRKAAPTDI